MEASPVSCVDADQQVSTHELARLTWSDIYGLRLRDSKAITPREYLGGMLPLRRHCDIGTSNAST